jgi:hypothetical protein
MRLLRQYVSITFCGRHLDSGDGNSLRVWSTEGGTAFTSNYMQIVPALNQYGKDTDQAHTEVSKTQAQTFYTFIAAYPTSCLAYRNFLSITPAMI